MATEKLVSYLVHPYPAVRSSSAEGLYLVHSTNISTEIDDSFMEIENILTNENWEGDLEKCKQLKKQLESLWKQ